MSAPSHTTEVFCGDFGWLIRELLKLADDKFPGRIGLAGVGNSGLVVVGGLCALSDRFRPIAVRKPSDHRDSPVSPPHDFLRVNGPRRVEKWVFVDDLISTGATVDHARKEVARKYPESKCVGILLYNNGVMPAGVSWEGIPIVSLPEKPASELREFLVASGW